MNTKKMLKSIFKNMFDDHVIYIISKYLKKKWSIDTTDFKKLKIKCSKKEKCKYSFHYYYS
jgi:hypothetical protein